MTEDWVVDVIFVSGKTPGVPGSIPGIVWGLVAPPGVSGAVPLGLLLSGSCCPGHLALGPVCWLGQLLFWSNQSLKGKSSN